MYIFSKSGRARNFDMPGILISIVTIVRGQDQWDVIGTKKISFTRPLALLFQQEKPASFDDAFIIFSLFLTRTILI